MFNTYFTHSFLEVLVQFATILRLWVHLHIRCVVSKIHIFMSPIVVIPLKSSVVMFKKVCLDVDCKCL